MYCPPPLIYFAFGTALYFFGGLVDMPHPTFAEGTWYGRRLADSAVLGLFLSVASIPLFALDQLVQGAAGRRPKDYTYHPRPSALWRCWLVPESRAILIIGLLLLAGWFAHSELVLRAVSSGAGGLVWPPERVVGAGLVAWGLLWLADCVRRPAGGTVFAAVLFLFFAVVCLPSASDILRE